MGTIVAVAALVIGLGILFGFIAIVTRPGPRGPRRKLSTYYTITGRRRKRPYRLVRPKRPSKFARGPAIPADDARNGSWGSSDSGGGDGGY